jgi:hypothetical protein
MELMDDSKTYCPFCVEVKNLLTQLGASYKTIELDSESSFSPSLLSSCQFSCYIIQAIVFLVS